MNRIDLRYLDELHNFHFRGGFGCDLFEIFFLDYDVAVFFVFVALHQVLARNRRLGLGFRDESGLLDACDWSRRGIGFDLSVAIFIVVILARVISRRRCCLCWNRLGAIELMKPDGLVASRANQTHRDRYETERQVAFPNSHCHCSSAGSFYHYDPLFSLQLSLTAAGLMFFRPYTGRIGGW